MENLFHLCSDLIPGGLIKVTLPDFFIYYHNTGFSRLFNLSEQEYPAFFDSANLDFIYPQDLDAVKEELSRHARDRSPIFLSFRILQKNATPAWIQLNGTYLEEYRGLPSYLCFLSDITKQQACQENILLEQQRSSTMAALQRDFFWEYDISKDTMTFYGNLSKSCSPPPLIRSLKQYIRKNAIIHPQDISRIKHSILSPSEKIQTLDLRIKNTLGIYTWYKLKYGFLFNSQKEAVRILGQSINLELPDAHTEASFSLLGKAAVIRQINEGIRQMPEHSHCGMMLLCLSRFAEYGKNFGFAFCQDLIHEFSLILLEQFNRQIIGHLGNGRFLIFFSAVAEEKELIRQAEAFLSSLENFCLRQNKFHIFCNIGLVLGDKEKSTYDILYKKAANALETAQKKGNLTYDIYGLQTKKAKNTAPLAFSPPFPKAAPSSLIPEEASNNAAGLFLNMPQQSLYPDADCVDPITSLPSFPRFLREGRHILTQNPEMHFALIYLDINKFRIFNQNFGFGIGNQILEFLGRSIQESLREHELGCRIEKDHFALLLRCEREDEIFKRLNRQLYNPLSSSAEAMPDFYRFSLSNGIYFIPSGETEISEMLDYANAARKSIKNFTGSHYACYTPHPAEKPFCCHTAAKKKCFLPFYQPRYSLSSGKITGAEALIHWENAPLSTKKTAEYLPLIKDIGMITDVDLQRIEQICRFLSRRLAAGLSCPPVSVNLSGVHFESTDFIKKLLSTLTRYKIPVSFFKLEINEEALIHFPEEAAIFINELKSFNFFITIDHFGEVYSPALLLKNISIDAVKLDIHAFCDKYPSSKGWLVLQKLIETVRGLGLEIYIGNTGEEELISKLQELGCNEIQSFLYSSPLSQTAYEALLDA